MLDLNGVFFLKKNIKLILGYRNTAIYDLSYNKVYLVSKSIGDKLSHFETQNEINDVLKRKFLTLGLGTLNFSDSEMMPLQFEYEQFDDCYLGNQCKLLYIEVTDKCNLNCIHCYAEIERKGQSFLSVEQFNNIILQVSTGHPCDIRLTGGEPFLNKNITDFIDVIHTKIKPSMKHSIVTNGTFNINQAIFALKMGFELQISIYGMTFDTFNKFTNSSKTVWNLVMSNLKKLSNAENKENILLCFAVNKLTYNEIDEFERFANKMGFRYILNRPASTGRAVKNWGALQLPLKEHCDFSKKTKASKLRLCYHMCQLHMAVVCVNGDVIPCSFLRKSKFIYGNIFNSTLENIWKSNGFMYFRALTPFLVDKCNKCEFMYVCTAGCCGEAEGLTNNILSCYPWCQIKPFENDYLSVTDFEMFEVDKLAAGTFEFHRII